MSSEKNRKEMWIKDSLPLGICDTSLYLWLMRGNVVTKCLAHKHNTLTHLWLEAGSCDQKFDTHTKQNSKYSTVEGYDTRNS